MTIITFSVPEELERDLNEVVKQMGFVSRSEAIRYALRLLSFELRSLNELRGKVLAVIAAVYGKESEKAKVYKVQHEYGDVINAYFHSHIEGAKCLEVMVVHGEAERVRGFISGLRASRDIEQMRIVVLDHVEG
ncbi:MAG: CopG family ribbon-helix-helix protein [Candidatus Nezhaarchaeota archaeon]|nr:CopG family ribbon-helix-helix protein [Candidatus Nezhaarchaeota archaeon]